MTRLSNFQPGQDWVWYAPNTKDAYGKEEIDAVKRALEKIGIECITAGNCPDINNDGETNLQDFSIIAHRENETG